MNNGILQRNIFALVTCVMLLSFPIFPLRASEENPHFPDTADGDLVLSLEQVIERALLANRNLRRNALQIQGSQFALDGSVSDFDWKLKPLANVGLSKDGDREERVTGLAGALSKKSEQGMETTISPSVAYVADSGATSGVGVSLAIPLVRGFNKEFYADSVDAARFALDTSNRNLYLAEVETVLESVALVYDLIRQQELLALYDAQEKRLLGHAATAGIMEASSLGTPIDTYRARIHLKDIQRQLTVAQEQYLNSLDRLRVILAVSMDSRLRIEAPLSYQVTRMSMEEAVSIALDHRLEMEQAAANLKDAHRKSRVAEHRLLPDLNAVAAYRKNTFLDSLATSEYSPDDSWSIGLTSGTDLARSQEKAAWQQSILEVRSAQLEEQVLRDTIQAEVKNQLTNLKKVEERIGLRQDQIVQAEGKMRLAEIKFTHGMGDNFDLIEAETELQQARADLLGEKTAYIVGQYRLRAVLGTLIAR